MSRQLASKYEHRYMGPDGVKGLRCEYCVHWFENRKRCGLIAADEGPVNGNDCCRFWFNPDMLAAAYPAAAVDEPKALTRKPTMNPPDLGRLLTKAEAAYVENVDESVSGCADCQFFTVPRTCTLIGPGTVDPKGACSMFWRNVRKEAADDRLHAEFKQEPPELDEAAAPARPWWRRILGGD